MARVLVGWELGGERGHAALVAPVARALLARGHEVALAVKDAAALGAGDGPLAACRILAAPAWPAPAAPGPPTSETVGDDLAALGLRQADEVLARARAWRGMLDALDTEVVVAESAPTLLLAARGRCPAVPFGTGYSLPPPGRPLPPVLDPQRRPAAASAANDEALRQAFDAADRALGGPGLAWFSDLFAAPAWVCNLPELDPYGSLRPVPAAGPLQLPEPAPARPPRPVGAHVFVYAKPAAVLPVLMDALVPHCRRLEIFIANAPAEVINPWPGTVLLHRQPVDLAARLAEFSAVVHFGGLNLATEALLAGVPQLIVPQHLEQAATALAVERLGAGRGLAALAREAPGSARQQELTATLVSAFCADAGLPARAAAVAVALRARLQPSLPGLVSLCERLARQ